jgi:ATP-dependent DNA ligase
MNRFGALLQDLSFLISPDDQVRLLADYFRHAPEPDQRASIRFLLDPPRRGKMTLKRLKEIVEHRTGPELFSLSRDFVGDLAETMALLWQPSTRPNSDLSPAEFAEWMAATGPLGLPAMVERSLDACDPAGRLAIIRLVTAGLRLPVPTGIVHRAMKECGLEPPPTRDPVTGAGIQADLFAVDVSAASEPGSIEAVVMYVEAGRSRKQPMLCTFGVWSDHAIIPLARIDAGEFRAQVADYASRHTTRRFGPSSEVEHSLAQALIGTLAFDGIEPSRRTKAGLSLKAPRLVAMQASGSAADASNLTDITGRLPMPHDHG